MQVNLGSLVLLLLLNISFLSAYNFEIKSDKKAIYPGEEFKVEFIFSFKDGSKIAEVNFSPPIFHNLHIKKEEENQTKTSQSWIYTLSVYKEGNITIDKAYLDIALKKDSNKTLGSFDMYDYTYLTFETKPLKIELLDKKPQTKLYGDFNITAKSYRQNDIVNLDIKITGSGNFEDIPPYKLDIKDATIYEDSPQRDKNLFLQKFVILSQKSFYIPSFELKYIDKNSKKLVTKQTKPIFVKVDEEKTTVTKKEEKSIKLDKKIYIYSLSIFFIGLLFGYIFAKTVKREKKQIDKDLLQKIEDAKDMKEVLKLLIAHNQNNTYTDAIKELEQDLYILKNNSVTKRDIKKKIFT